MNRAHRIVSLIVLGLFAVPALAQVEIVLDPANGKAELVAGRSAEDIAKGVKISTRLPDGTVEEGVWDINPLDERGPLVGVRILNMQSFVQTQDIESYVVIRLKSRWEGAGYPAHHTSRVPDEYIATSNEQLELSWCMYEATYVDIGTCAADEDTGTIQAFTKTKDGVLREGLWEENVSGKPTMRIVTPWPFGIDKLEDGSYEFIIDSINSTPSHGEFSADYQVNHGHTKTLPVKLHGAVDGDASSNRGPQTFDLVFTIDTAAAQAAASVTSSNIAALQAAVADVEQRLEFIFSNNEAVIPIQITFASIGSVAQAGVQHFLVFLDDARVGLRDQAFFDEEDDDDELYGSIPFQAGADFIRYVGQEGVVIPPRTTKYINAPISLRNQVQWFANTPTTIPSQVITFNSDLVSSSFPWSFDIRDHGF